MKTIIEFFKNLFIISPDDDDEEEEEKLEPLPEKESISYLKETSRNNSNVSSKPVLHKRSFKTNQARSEGSSLEIDYITIPRDDKDALELAKITIDKLQNGHPVIASAKEVIRDGKYYFMLFGACYAMQCKIEKITQFSYLFLPRSYNVNALNKKEFIHPENKETFLNDLEDSSF